MRKIYLFVILLVVSVSVMAQQSVIKITTSKAYNDSFVMYPTSTSKEDAILVDWGDGEVKSYNINPNASAYFARVDGTIKGDTIQIQSKLVKLDISSSSVTSLIVENQPLLELLDVSSNELTSDKLVLDGVSALKNLNLGSNQFTTLDMRALNTLEYFSASNNEALSTVLFADGCATLKQISMEKCDISHFYPISLPALTSLNLAEGSLMELEIGDNYPSLISLDVNDNYISTLDVSKCAYLSTLNVSNNQLEEINVAENPELTKLYCSGNKLTRLNLQHNPLINGLSCDNNQIKELRVGHMSKLQNLSCGGNQLQSLNLSNNFYLTRLVCNDNQLSFLDFAGNPNMDFIDCRNNAKMTPCALNYMFSTLLARNRDAYSANLLIAGSNGETSDTDEVNSGDMKWKTDVEGDGSAVCDSVALTLEPVQNGTYKLMQPARYGKEYREIGSNAMAGTPVKVVAEPASDYAFKSVTVDGQEIADSLFVVSNDATVAINFVSTLIPHIVLTTTKGTSLTFSLCAATQGTEVSVDWGDGMEQVYKVSDKETFIDGMATGEKVIIKGEVVAADFASYPGVGEGWDNQLTGIDVSHCPQLQSLSTYMNPIQTLDVSACPDLIYLDCAYSELSELNIHSNSELMKLRCYGNNLKSLDVKNCKALTYLDAKVNQLSTLDLTQNVLLTNVDLQSNQLTEINVKGLTALETLYLNNNQLKSIDVTKNEKLIALAVSNNALTQLDLVENSHLLTLQCADNQLQGLDLSAQKLIYYVNCEGNKFSACDLNDLYYSLPQYPTLDELLKSFALWVKGNNPETANDAEHAESLIAKGKGWTINYDGDGTGCGEAYITILPTENGTIRLFDSQKQEVLSGSKVEKNTTLAVETIPAEGYSVKSLKANGKDIVDGAFTVTCSTEVQVKFQLGSSLDENTYTTFTVRGSKGGMQVEAPLEAMLTVYTTNGALIGDYSVSGETFIPLAAGTYLVNVRQPGGAVSSKQILIIY